LCSRLADEANGLKLELNVELSSFGHETSFADHRLLGNVGVDGIEHANFRWWEACIVRVGIVGHPDAFAASICALQRHFQKTHAQMRGGIVDAEAKNRELLAIFFGCCFSPNRHAIGFACCRKFKTFATSFCAGAMKTRISLNVLNKLGLDLHVHRYLVRH
jgi:hypothetical protein